MKLNQIFKEAIPPTATGYPQVTEVDVTNLCDVTGLITIHNNLVDVAGNVALKANKAKMLKQLPFKFGKVDGMFDALDALKLENLVNFPNEADSIDISMNMGMRSLAGGEHTKCQTFLAVETALESLEGCPKAYRYDFSGNENLTSTTGMNIEWAGGISLNKCLKLVDVRSVLGPISGGGSGSSSGSITWHPTLPLIGLILLNGQPDRVKFTILFPSNDAKLLTIYRDYKGKGLGYAIELADELRNKGYEGNCKF